MKFLEKDLEDIIDENFQCDTTRSLLYDRGLSESLDVWKTFRQVRIGNYGIADFITINKPVYIPKKHRTPIDGNYVDPLEITIYELKKDSLTVSAFLQGVRYMKGISRYLNLSKRFSGSVHFNIVLIGESTGGLSDLIYLPDFLSSRRFSLSIYTYQYKIDGVKFTLQENYCLKKEGFILKN